MKSTILSTIVIGSSLVLMACSGGSKAEKSDTETATETATQAADSTETAETEATQTESAPALAPCTAGADVPAGATNCLLDLGQGEDTYWNDSDGVDPGTAGCHYEFTDDSCSENLADRTFGELCLDDDRLVESNPGKDECHTHGNDMGKPDIVSCSQWCESQGETAGRCESGVEASGAHGSCQSARCVCG